MISDLLMDKSVQNIVLRTILNIINRTITKIYPQNCRINQSKILKMICGEVQTVNFPPRLMGERIITEELAPG